MLRLFPALILMFGVHLAFAQSLIGAWEAQLTDSEGQELRNVVIITEGFQVATTYDQEGRFIRTNGGKWTRSGNQITELVEFDSQDSTRVEETFTFAIELTDKTLQANGVTWTRIDDGTPGALQGAWLISGRKRNGEISKRDTDRPRKTMKILSGTRFQWIAYNTATRDFLATGGGTYSTQNGRYTEQIEFFSRDDSRVGASLDFDFELIDGDWHHSGKSSQGDPLYEIWSPREDMMK